MGNYILDFVDKELLAHRKKKEKVSQQESSYILQETIKKQEEINSKEGIINNKQSEEEKSNQKILEISEKNIVSDEIEIQEKGNLEEEKEIIVEEKETKKVIMTTMMNTHSLEELADEKNIPPQQKDKNSIVSKEIINILEWSNTEQSILSFNEEEEYMDKITSKEQNMRKKAEEKKMPKKKNKMKTIVFQAIVGLVLIIISVLYLVESPAEQKVLKSGMSIWIDKIKVLLWNSNDYLNDKFLTDLDENRKKMLLDIDNSLEKANNCTLTWIDLKNDIQQLENFRATIGSMSLDEFKKQHMSIEMQVESIKNGEIIQKCY